ncbi:glycosyltransferase [Stenotrophomonas maltophilia]|uniref:glycosyltransferase n=1 Tax=Stenotrophomonas maltophilia TaxID=40324 RepID=UPI000DA9725F|nr:glycosyltransferase [Stenotrophomonas maltophilia]
MGSVDQTMTNGGMQAVRILICAHDFQPNPSPQSLRVTQLASGLASLGHDVHVLTRTCGAGMRRMEDPPGLQVHRTSPQGVEALIDATSRVLGHLRRLRRQDAVAGTRPSPQVASQAAPTVGTAALNRKGRAIARLRSFLDARVFPDGRSRWIGGALRHGRQLISQWSPQVIIGSHEPVAGLLLASALSRESGIPFVAELGDPVLTSYTPERWRAASLELERRVCQEAGAIVVTSEATAALMQERHGPGIAPLSVIPQGFARVEPPLPEVVRSAGGLQLVYTGRFYPFRDPMPLVRAVLASPGCTLTIAGPGLPPELAKACAEHPQVLRFAGSLDHYQAIELQRGADVLVNIGNAGMTQIPGKLLEYLGSGRPVLHLQPDAADPAAAIIGRERCGFLAANEVAAISALLHELLQRKQQGRLDEGLRLGPDAFAEYRWDRLAERLAAVCRNAAMAGQRQA